MTDGGWGMSGWGGTLSSGGGSSGDGAVVSNYIPAAGSPITPGTPVEFDVTGVNGAVLVALVVTVFYPDTGASEVVYDRNGFTPNYLPNGTFLGSERQTITDGFHFILRRRGGWPLSPQVKVEGGTNQGGPVTQP